MAEEIMHFDLPVNQSSIIKVIGIGGGGSNAVNHMFRQGIRDVNFVVCNTDAQALEKSPVPIKVQLGESLTEGRGAGNKPEVGKQAAIESLSNINRILSSNTKMVFITAGMGGGTGTGAAPVIAQAAKELGILTVAIVTIPFRYEGQVRINQAITGINELKEHVDSLLVINNEKLREVFGDLRLSDAFAKADDILSIAAKGIAEIITVPGYVNVDFADVQTVMVQSGVAIMGTGFAEGENRAETAIEQALTSPLLNNNDIKGAKNILLNITSGNEEVTMDEVSEITEFITREAASVTNIIWGAAVDEKLGKQISVTIIATGFPANSIPELYQSKRDVEKVELDDEKTSRRKMPDGFVVKSRRSSPQFEDDFSVTQKVIDFEVINRNNERISLEEGEEENGERNVQVPSKDPNERLRHLKETQTKLKEKNYISVDEKEEIDKLEAEPAYIRKNVKLKPVDSKNSEEVSRYSLSEDDESSPQLRPDNSYLHDNVD
jgi:cell division protein FtsZ